MSIINRLNEMVLRRIRGREDEASAEHIAKAVEKIIRLVSLRSEQYVGDTLLLMAELSDGSSLQATEESQGWKNLLTTLDHSGRTTMSSTEWQLSLIADTDNKAIYLIGSPSDRTGQA